MLVPTGRSGLSIQNPSVTGLITTRSGLGNRELLIEPSARSAGRADRGDPAAKIPTKYDDRTRDESKDESRARSGHCRATARPRERRGTGFRGVTVVGGVAAGRDAETGEAVAAGRGRDDRLGLDRGRDRGRDAEAVVGVAARRVVAVASGRPGKLRLSQP